MDWGRVLSAVVAVLGVLVTASANLTDIFGPNAAKLVVSVAGLAMSVISALNAALFQGQANLVTAVAAMPGVSRIITNHQANDTLASIANDPANPKVEPPK